jgi:protein gp37
MGYPTPIEWTDATWNPVGGCDILSPGCINCYAMRLAASARLKNHPLYAGTTKMVKGKPVWNGMLTIAPDGAKVWEWPLIWRGAKQPKLGPGMPSMIFVDDMADLFHIRRPIQHIDRVMVAALRSKHVIQLLTKRADVLADYIENFSFLRAINNCAEGNGSPVPMIGRDSHDSLLRKFGLHERWSDQRDCSAWPNPHLWLGFSAERQQEFDERWYHMRPLAKAGWQVFVSIEPMLDEIVLPLDFLYMPKKPWVIVGGETGKDARPIKHPDWSRSLRDQCASRDLPFLKKQWGEFAPYDRGRIDGAALATPYSTDLPIQRFGKKAAGRLLDGVLHNAFPEIAA